MKNKILITLSFLFFLSIHADENKIKQKIEKILPSGAEIESIQPSKFPGIYKVFYGDLQPIYVSNDEILFARLLLGLYVISKLISVVVNPAIGVAVNSHLPPVPNSLPFS